MTWFKVDDKLHSHPKVVAAKLEAIGLWTLAGSHCADYKTGGFVSTETAARLAGSLATAKRAALRLVDAELWDVVDGGWRYHDWDVYQPTPDEIAARVESISEKRRVSGRLGAQKRWQVAIDANGKPDGKPMANAIQQNGKPMAPIPIPIPIPNQSPQTPMLGMGGKGPEENPFVHVEPEPSPTEGVTPIRSATVATGLLDEYASVANTVLGPGFSADRFAHVEIEKAVNASVGGQVLSFSEVKARLRFSVDRYLRTCEQKWNSWTQPKQWRQWIANGNGWTLAKSPPAKVATAPRSHLTPLPKPAPPSAEVLAALDAADAVMGNVRAATASGVVPIVAANDDPAKGVGHG